ncbi:2-keto-4-pentenoate hydratase [Eupransor demetentiae]|uniref:2-keto-4-pentenoate hydratase (MhpD) n=1 Tax=Eupransor demetentiae TaxID=3109584 RepID=A0ABM9N3Y3_9LACO|nr:2-keto-4-pentenoate hydratase (MhpD) [Lactobacillaceae bacterium LMG 33000]
MTTQTQTSTKTLAQALFDAYQSRKPLDRAHWEDELSDDDRAYQTQDALMKLKNQGVGGYKVFLTSKETQDMFASNEPLYGAQVPTHFLKAPARLSLSKDLMDPLAEVELVFHAREDLKPSDTLEELATKTTVAGGLEVPDSRFADWFPKLSKYLVMADAAVGGYVVYGPERDSTDLGVDKMAQVEAKLFHNGEQVAEGKSSEVLGNPLLSLQWLVKKLASQGKTLKAGQRVSSGTFLLPPKLTAGEWKVTFNQDFDDLVLDVVE